MKDFGTKIREFQNFSIREPAHKKNMLRNRASFEMAGDNLYQTHPETLEILIFQDFLR